MKKFLLLMVCALIASNINAQLTTGEPSAKKIRTGNRPEAGNFGIYMGITSDMFKGWTDGDIKVSSLPLINLKYMATDRMEVRLGMEFAKTREKIKGDEIIDIEDYKTENLSASVVESSNIFYPGFAYHFAPINILDVYVGAELPIGWSKNVSTMEAGSDKSSVKKSSFDIGLGAFIGLQAFVADLPFAIGFEYGISSMFQTGLKYKQETVLDGEKQVVYTASVDDLPKLAEGGSISGNEVFDSLKAKKGEIGHQFRVTLTYYFGK